MLGDKEIKRILKSSKTIAVIGCSRNPSKDAYMVPKYLQDKGYRIIPVNPHADKILGEKVYRSISEINFPVDIVDIFRPASECFGIVQEIAKLKIKPKLIWMQLGIKDENAAELAGSNGIAIVMDRCMMAEHKRLIEFSR